MQCRIQPLPEKLEPVIGPWLETPEGLKQFREAIHHSVKQCATHVCKDCDTFAVVGWGYKDKIVCKECGKPMSSTGNETINNQLKQMINSLGDSNAT